MRCAVYIILLAAAALAALAQPFTVTRVGKLSHFAISESSGLAASRQYPGVLWTHNDGGFQFLYAVNQQGNLLGAFQVPGTLVDWEDVAIDKAGNLYLADIGTNGMPRTHVAVHRVREPNPYKQYGNAKLLQTWLLRFPGGPPEDCEAFFVHGGFGHLVTKRPTNGAVTMFRFSLADTRRSIPLKRVTHILVDEGPITAAALSKDGQRLGLTSSDGVFLFFLTGGPSTAGTAGRLFFDHKNDFMEGGTFFGDGFMTSTETRRLFFFEHPSFLCRQAPQLLTAVPDVTVDAGTNVLFRMVAEGCPSPTYAWSLNGVPIPGATNTTLSITNPSVADAGVYQFTASNRLGIATSSGTLTVLTTRDVRITEVMTSPALDATVPTADWFELTNFELEPVDISGWRFNDNSGGLTDAFVIPDGTVILSDETIIFVEDLTESEFIAWWGPENVPDYARIFTYSGAGLSFDNDGDELFLWDSDTNRVNTVDAVTLPAAASGFSFRYDLNTDTFGISEFGRYGGVKAATSSDIGSPGVLTGF